MSAQYNIFLEDNSNLVIMKVSDNFGLVDFLQNKIKDEQLLIHHIDPNGTTTFNGIQSEILFNQLSRFDINSLSNDQKITFQDTLQLLQKCSVLIHTFVIFQGD